MRGCILIPLVLPAVDSSRFVRAKSVRMFVQFALVLIRGMPVQLVDRVLVVVLRFLAGGVNVRMRVLMRVGD
jgi:hypothetical protein